MRVLSVRLVASTAATMSAVPTGAFVRQTIPKFYNYWWLRSPDTYSGGYAWIVTPSGVVDSNDYTVNFKVSIPYGRTISPDSFMYYNYTSFYVIEDGNMVYICSRMLLRNILISSYAHISSLCRIAGLREFVFQLFYFHKGAYRRHVL